MEQEQKNKRNKKRVAATWPACVHLLPSERLLVPLGCFGTQGAKRLVAPYNNPPGTRTRTNTGWCSAGRRRRGRGRGDGTPFCSPLLQYSFLELVAILTVVCTVPVQIFQGETPKNATRAAPRQWAVPFLPAPLIIRRHFSYCFIFIMKIT